MSLLTLPVCVKESTLNLNTLIDLNNIKPTRVLRLCRILPGEVVPSTAKVNASPIDIGDPQHYSHVVGHFSKPGFALRNLGVSEHSALAYGLL
jgi:hypothetical protein